MTASSFAIRDSVTMFRRDLRRALRFPGMTLSGILTPLLMMLLFVYVLGGMMSGGLAGGSYLDYVAPAMIVMTVCMGSALTAVNLSMDMNEGIIARFRTMAIFRPSVLVGIVAGSVLRTMISVVIVLAAAVLLGFRPVAGPLEWLAALGLTAFMTIAIQWLSVSIGLRAKSPGGANGATLPLQFGTFISSAFVDPATMPAAVGWFAENQPLTPIIDTIRGLLLGTPIGSDWIVALAWCTAITAYCFVRSRAIFNREPRRI